MSFNAKTSLPHRLPPSAYWEPAIFETERRWMLENTWQLVGVLPDLNKSGDFVTREVLSQPIIVRNFDSELVALQNVCAHRHSLIRSEKRGNSDELSCQYHGWCYGSDGRTRRIPCAKDFAPIDRERFSISKYRCESVGQLVFVTCDPKAMPLAEFLGPAATLLRDRTGNDYAVTLQTDIGYEANWKVAVENTLEAYHIQSVHPNTFRKEPGELRSTHVINARHSSFKTDMPFAPENRTDLFFQNAQSKLVRWLGRDAKAEYEHHHVYPNLLISFTDATTVIQSVMPIDANRSESIVYQFGLVPQTLGRTKRWVARRWGALEAGILKRILLEDVNMLPKIQRGLQSSTHAGVLGRCEERIAAFSKLLVRCNDEECIRR